MMRRQEGRLSRRAGKGHASIPRLAIGEGESLKGQMATRRAVGFSPPRGAIWSRLMWFQKPKHGQ